MAENLTTAHEQWATRPADQRFASVLDLHEACTRHHREAREAVVPLRSLRVIDSDGDLLLEGKKGTPAHFTNWSFSQLSRKIQAPSSYLATLPRPLAADCLTAGISRGPAETPAALLLGQNGVLKVRALTSEKYDRIWNCDITRRLLPLVDQGWQAPPARPAKEGAPGSHPATAEEIARMGKGTLVREGDIISPAGLYASDRDMFAFMVNESFRISDGTDQGLARGFFVQNSEVGDCTFTLTMFLYRYICGNHIVWDAQGVKEIRIKHIGTANDRAWRHMQAQVSEYAAATASDDEARIKQAKVYEIGSDKNTVLDLLFGRKIASREVLENSWEKAEEFEKIDGTPTTAWGFAQGMTRYSQALHHTDKRADLDRAAGKVLSMAF
jgi:hypothetical protein